MSPSDPRAQALAWLRAELAHLEAQELAPTQQAIIRRILARAVECGPILRDIWSPDHVHPTWQRPGTYVWRIAPGADGDLIDWHDPDTHAQAIEAERARILQTIILTAADAPARAAAIRTERRELPALLEAFAHHARQAAQTLERIHDHAARAGLALPGPLVDLPELIERAADLGGPDSFQALKPRLDTLAGQFWRDWPDPASLLQALSETADRYGYAEPDLYPVKRQAHALNDYLRALDVHLDHVWPTLEALEPWAFNRQDLAALAAVGLDLEPDEIPTDPRPRPK